jgi:hypothetical protein
VLSNNSFTFNQHCQLVFVFSLHRNLFWPITKLARHSSLNARSFPPFFTSSFLSLLAKLWDPLVSPISFSRGQSGLKDESQPDAPPHPCLPNPRSPRSYKSCDLPFPLLPLSPACPLLLLLHPFCIAGPRAPRPLLFVLFPPSCVALHRCLSSILLQCCRPSLYAPLLQHAPAPTPPA